MYSENDEVILILLIDMPIGFAISFCFLNAAYYETEATVIKM